MTKKYRMINFYFISITFINFCIAFAFYVSTMMAVGFSIDILNESASNAGLASGIFIIGTLFARFSIGIGKTARP